MHRNALILALLVCLITTLPALAQPEKGSTMISGTVSFSHYSGDLYSSYTDVMLAPNVSYFLTPNVALGGELAGGLSSGNGYTTTRVLIGPSLNVYFSSASQVVPYVGGALLLESESHRYSGHTFTYSGNSIKLRAGLAWFVRPALALTPEFQINFDTREEPEGYWNGQAHTVNMHGTVVSFGMGISGLLGPHKK
ncbi:MAG TPA: outer membrane beta-barrel protein [bacterium]|jgi:hypothetical protein